jgi:hypothetical protein
MGDTSDQDDRSQGGKDKSSKLIKEITHRRLQIKSGGYKTLPQ